MGIKTGIEWTESTWNPIRGCSRVSEGCRNCYAETVANRFKGPGEPYEGLIAKGGQWNGKVKLVEHKMDEPLRWTKPRMIFVNSMSDLFHPDVPDSVIADVFRVMAQAKHHTFQILTKRPERMNQFLNRVDNAMGWFTHDGTPPEKAYNGSGMVVGYDKWPLPNVWLGVSVEDQATADARIPLLLDTPAAVRWISAEPLLGPIVVDDFLFRGDHSLRETDPLAAAMLAESVEDGCGWIRPAIDWVVVGGESGPGARPMHPDWARYLRDRCQAAEVPFLFKQWGEWAPETVCATEHGARTALFIDYDGSTRPAAFGTRGQATTVQKNGKKQTGRNLDGRTWDQYPEATQ